MLFCKHDYELISEVDTKSEAEQLHSMGLRPMTLSSFTKKYILVLKCTVCGKIKKIVTKSN